MNPAGTDGTKGRGSSADFSEKEIEPALRQGEDLLTWWKQVENKRTSVEWFELFPEYPQLGMSATGGFWGEAPIQGQKVRVMGEVNELFWDRPRVPKSERREASTCWSRWRRSDFSGNRSVSRWQRPRGLFARATAIPSVMIARRRDASCQGKRAAFEIESNRRFEPRNRARGFLGKCICTNRLQSFDWLGRSSGPQALTGSTPDQRQSSLFQWPNWV